MHGRVNRVRLRRGPGMTRHMSERREAEQPWPDCSQGCVHVIKRAANERRGAQVRQTGAE